MSEELLQKGYIDPRGRARGEAVGPYEGFNLGATTLDQLRKYKIIPDQSYGRRGRNKPDGIVVDRRGQQPVVKFVVEYKNTGGLLSKDKTREFSEKVAEEYCRPLSCEFGGVSDHKHNSWLLVTSDDCREILREDDYPLDYPIALGEESGRELLGRTLLRLETNLNKPRGALQAVEAVNPTRLAEQTWQDIWLASGEQPEACLSTFIEMLIFKFLSDQGVLSSTPSGVPVDFDTIMTKSNDKILRYYFDNVRPEIRRLFPAGVDGTSIINGIVLNPDASDQGRFFQQILQRFGDFGSLRRIDPEFKSRIFERFLKKSMSVKNWGQYFTPRNIVKAMVEMSGVEFLTPGSVVCDPACGVGGFLLEPLMNKRPNDFRSADAKGLKYVGWDRDDKTIILAKANMLVHLSDAMEKDSVNAIQYLAPDLNNTFQSTSKNLTGSLGQVPVEEFDLVMTNPPYVTRGTGKQRDFLREHHAYYSVPGSGIENLFIQLIINGLKPGGRALIVVPDGLMLRHSEEALRRRLLQTCDLEAVVSLPVNTFYSTPKKTYILVIRKKQKANTKQRAPVFSYMITSVGETLDAKRFVIAENDLPAMASLFRLFQGNPEAFSCADPRCKVFPIERFAPEEHWLVNKWWSLEERERLGDIGADAFVGANELSDMLQETSLMIGEIAADLSSLDVSSPVERTVTLSLADTRYFRMGIGNRVLKKNLFHAEAGSVPLYSANVDFGKEHGWIKTSNLDNFEKPSLLWSIDSDFNMTVRDAGVVFATTDHCGRLEVLDASLDPAYVQAAIIYGYGRTFGFDRVTRPSLGRMKKVTLRVPVKSDGSFDLEAQRVLAREFTDIRNAIRVVEESLASISGLKPRVEISKEAQDMGEQRGAVLGGALRRRREERIDEVIAAARILEIEKGQVLRGAKLEERLAALTGQEPP
jgi:type I restriction enzyme M protein